MLEPEGADLICAALLVPKGGIGNEQLRAYTRQDCVGDDGRVDDVHLLCDQLPKHPSALR